MYYYWTKSSLYCVIVNPITRKFYVDFINIPENKNSRINVLYGIPFLKTWYINNTAVLIALKDRNYIYVGSKIIHFTMDEGDMIVRFLPSFGNTNVALITRFNTIFFTEGEEPYYLIDKRISRPPELNFGFRINDDFNTNYAMLYHKFDFIHNGIAIRSIVKINV